MSARNTLLVVIGVLAAAAGVFLVLLGRAPPRGSVASERPVAPLAASDAPSGSVAPLAEPPRALRADAEGDSPTSVLWPLRVELELVRASHVPEEPGVQPFGSGSSARLSGLILGPDGGGARCEIVFSAGANAGRVLRTDATGAFGATDLFPGLSIVDVRGPSILGSRRLVRLRQDREQLLNISYGRPASVLGRVIDREANGIAGAEVVVDGTRVTSDTNGDFQLASVAAGEVLVEVEKPGYALHQETASLTGGVLLPRERLTLALEPEASLVISIEGNVGGPGPVRVLLLPGNFEQRSVGTRSMRYPWHKVGPLEVHPGTPLRVGGLPAEVVRVYAFRAGAVSQPRVANLRSEGEFPLSIHLQPAPRITGVVTYAGRTVAGAKVRLEAPNAVRAMLSFFREPSYFLETGVLPLIPPAVQEVETDQGGHFALTSWSDLSPVRWLEVRGAGGAWAGRLVRSAEEHLEIELADAELAGGELTVVLPGRTQGLPIELLVNGAPTDPFVLSPREDLVVESLLAGLWRFKASWHGTPVHEDPRLAIEGSSTLVLTLPPEAIEGQDPETWRRAGRDAPF